MVLQEVEGTDLTPAIKTSKPKTQRRKRTLSDGLNIAEYGRVHVDGKSGGSGRRERGVGQSLVRLWDLCSCIRYMTVESAQHL